MNENKFYILFSMETCNPRIIKMDRDMGKLINHIIGIAMNEKKEISICLDEKEMKNISEQILCNMCWGYITSQDFRLMYAIGEYNL